MDMKTMTRLLREAQEAVERLACGEEGMLDNADTAQDVADLLIEAQALAQLVEDETNRRFTRLDDSEIEDVVNEWFESASQVGSRRGECA